jgi:hypothetical protein
MSTLSGQSIQNTYDGLLKLSNSTTGITETTQAIEDGLGNNTGGLIKQGQIWGGGMLNLNTNNIRNEYYGNGMNAAGTVPANIQNAGFISQIFYDAGVADYSAFTMNIITATTGNDILQWAFYSPQVVTGRGLAPKDLVVSGIVDPSTTGIKTSATTFSFSGVGGGPIFFLYRIKNSGSNPTFRPAGSSATANQNVFNSLFLGFTASLTNVNVYNQPQEANVGITNATYYSSLTGGFPSTFTAAEIEGATVANLATVPTYGFLLHTIR